MAGKGGGAWKVAYADFVTAMMAFFLVMWLVSQSAPVKEAIAHHFQDPFSLDDPMENDEHGDHKKKSNYKPRTPPKKEHEEEHLPIPPDRIPHLRGERTVVGTELYFAEDSNSMDPNSLRRLADILPVLAGKPNKIDIRGHATRKPPKQGAAFQDPWDLCYARCAATRKFLIDNGIPPEQIRLSQAGPFEPRRESFNADEVARNARVEVYLLSEFVNDLPGEPRKQAASLFGKEETVAHAGEEHGKDKHDSHGHSPAKHGDSGGHDAEKPHGASPGHDAHDAHGDATESPKPAHGASDSHGAKDHSQGEHGDAHAKPSKAPAATHGEYQDPKPAAH